METNGLKTDGIIYNPSIYGKVKVHNIGKAWNLEHKPIVSLQALTQYYRWKISNNCSYLYPFCLKDNENRDMSQGKAVQQIHLLSSKSQLNELCHALLRLYRRFCQETSCFCWGKEWRGAGKGALREFSWCQGRMSIFAFLKKRKEKKTCAAVPKGSRSVLLCPRKTDPSKRS